MTHTYRIELDTVRKSRNTSEYRNINRATCEGISTQGDGAIVQQLCAILAENNPHIGAVVEVWRGATLVFHKMPLKQWAGGKAVNTGEQPEHLRRASK